MTEMIPADADDSDSSIISLTSSVADDAEGSHNGDEDSDGDLARGLARVAIDGDEPEVIDLISDDDERAERGEEDDDAAGEEETGGGGGGERAADDGRADGTDRLERAGGTQKVVCCFCFCFRCCNSRRSRGIFEQRFFVLFSFFSFSFSNNVGVVVGVF